MSLVNIRTKYRYTNMIGLIFFTIILLLAETVSADSGVQPTPVALSNDLEIESASVHFIRELDSLAFELLVEGNKLQVIVPAYRLKGITKFAFDAVSAYLQVNTSDNTMPMLGVYKVYDVLSGDLSLPFKVDTR